MPSRFVQTQPAILLSLAFLLTGSVRSEESWRFLDIPDWHNAEKYVSVWSGAWSNQGYSSYAAFRSAKQAEDQARVQTFHSTFGGELVIIPGDLQNGHWWDTAFVNNFKSVAAYSGLNASQVVIEASHLCYTGLKEAFSAGGYPTMLVAVGDHEVGDNDWPTGSAVSTLVPSFRTGFADIWNEDTGGNNIYNTPIGTATARPLGTPYAATSHAVQHKNVLFITVDIFQQDGPNTNLGPTGTVIGSMTVDHLAWFTDVLAAANNIPSIKHIFVQAHLPAIYPVRKFASSGMLVTNNENSEFFQAMRQYGVDVYFCGEVHANTVTLDSASDLVQVANRGNNGSNINVVDVEDDRITMNLFKDPTIPLGNLVIDKSGPQTAFSSSGHMTPIDPTGLQIHIPFDTIAPASAALTCYEGGRSINGTLCSDSFPNDGNFSDDYTAFSANAPIGQGKVGAAAILNSSSLVGMAAIGPIAGQYQRSVACWVKTTSSGRQIVFNTTSKWSATKQYFNLSINEGKLELMLQNNILKTVQGPLVNDGLWHHIAAVVPQNPCTLAQAKLFIDGIQQTNLTHTGGTTTIDTTQANWMSYGTILSDASINIATAYGMQAFTGSLDDMAVWTRALTNAEVKALAAGPDTRSYDASDMEKLFKLQQAATGSTTAGAETWAFDPNVTGTWGVFQTSGSEMTIVLGGGGGLRATIAPDSTPPSPDPASFLSGPESLYPTSVSMTAQIGSDASGPVEYLFTETSGNFGGSSSGWQANPTWTAAGLLPSTRYSYTVTMRDAVGNTGSASPAVAVTTAQSHPGPRVAIAWHTPSNTIEGTPANDATPDVFLPGISGSISGGRDSSTTFNSTDLNYGSLAAPASPLGANAIRVRNTGVENLVTLTVSNGGLTDLKLGAFHFDFGGFDAGPLDFNLVYLSGSLDDPNGTAIATGSRLAGSIATTNYQDFDLPLRPALADTTLAPGQSATFQLVFSNASSATSASGVDNIAITTASTTGPDRDSDGIPDSLEDANGLDADNPDDAALDPDRDGQSNFSEILMGTALDDSNDYLRLVPSLSNSSSLLLDVSEILAGRTYILEFSGNLSESWLAMDAAAPTASESNLPHVFQQPLSGLRGFYRLRVEWAGD